MARSSRSLYLILQKCCGWCHLTTDIVQLVFQDIRNGTCGPLMRCETKVKLFDFSAPGDVLLLLIFYLEDLILPYFIQV